MDQRISDLYSEYRSGLLDRRDFFKRLSILVGGAAAAYVPWRDRQARAGVAPRAGQDLVSEYVTYPGVTGDMRAYMAHLEGEERRPAVIVIHENRGLQPHIEDVARRAAHAGFLTIAPDALSPLGGTPEDEDEARTLMRELDSQETIGNLFAAVQYLKTHPLSTGKVGCTGFCWGGGMTNQVAVNAPDLAAAVPFYGSQPAVEDVPKIKAAMLIHYAGTDDRINQGIPAFEEALRAASIEYQIFMYEGAQHAFHNETNASRYHEEAAKLAWKRTITFFYEKLKT